jgi:hypothetical protein
LTVSCAIVGSIITIMALYTCISACKRGGKSKSFAFSVLIYSAGYGIYYVASALVFLYPKRLEVSTTMLSPTRIVVTTTLEKFDFYACTTLQCSYIFLGT